MLLCREHNFVSFAFNLSFFQQNLFSFTYLQDQDGQTAYDLACLHGQHECARLLRALHWADNKDASLNSRLKKDSVRKVQEQELVSLHTRLKEEAAKMAYDDWLERKNVGNSRLPTPAACERRKKVPNSSGQRSSSCTTCTRTHSKHQSASMKKRAPQIATPIKVNPHQETRNVDSVGKSEKLYPYTNYPPKHLRSLSSEELCKSSHTPKSGRSSRSTFCSSGRSSRQSLSAKKSHRKPGRKQKSICKSLAKQQGTVKPEELDGHTSETESVSMMIPDMNEEDSKSNSDNEIATSGDSTENGEHDSEDFSMKSNDLQAYYFEDDEHDHTEDFSTKSNDLQAYFSDDDEDDLFFHDVGDTNNLDALALPNTLTKDKTPAEVLQTLRAVSGSSSRSFKRSQSARRNSIQLGNYNRRLSLSAIPEGRMVTSYSDEEHSTSQLLDDDFVEALIRSFSSSHETNGKETQTTTDDVESRKIAWQIGDRNDEEETVSKAEVADMTSETGPEIKVSSPLDDQLHRNITLDLSNANPSFLSKTNHSEEGSQTCYSPGCTDECPQTLKVVNIEWDPTSNTVQSNVTACPLTPPPEHSQRQLSLRQLTPPSGKLSPSSLSSKENRFSPRALSPSLSSSQSSTPASPTFNSEIEGQVDIDSSPPSRSYYLTSLLSHPGLKNHPNSLSLSSKSMVMSSCNNAEDGDTLHTSGIRHAKSAPEMRKESENPTRCVRT